MYDRVFLIVVNLKKMEVWKERKFTTESVASLEVHEFAELTAFS